MAKAREIPGLHAGMPFAEAAAATVAVRAEELFEQSENVLDMSDIERVHDMRVASRRLRAVMEIYAPCFPTHEFKPLLREVKDLADALGTRRDPDVLLDQLAKLESVLPKTDAPGVEAFAAPVHDEQAQGNEILAAALDHAERMNLRGRLALLAASAVAPEEADVAEAVAANGGAPASEAEPAAPAADVGAEAPVLTPDAVAAAPSRTNGTDPADHGEGA
jgi:inorganic triphosphatase YgiF